MCSRTRKQLSKTLAAIRRKALASEGIAVYTFDFAGEGPKKRADGTPGSISDGETTEMSVMTEIKDLESVLEAAKHADEINGLVLLYPALLI